MVEINNKFKEIKCIYNNVGDMDEKNCSGCRACEHICPTKAIKMIDNSEGFMIPNVYEKKCINCKLCIKRCPQIEDVYIEENIQEVYAAKQKDENILLKSTSGGVFDALAREILKKQGSVFGCAWNDELVAEHIEVNKEEDLYKLYGSKYVQSDTKDTFLRVEELLKANKYVLYSGTACQIAGLKKFLGKNYETLFTVDIICHGVPSPLLFKKYLEWLSEKYNSKVTSFEFRNKEKTAWGLTYKAKVKANSKIKYLNSNFDPYYKAFLECKTYRECCYKCKYANEKRISDITLGDYWGLEKEHQHFFDDRGVSVVILNSNQGIKLFNSINCVIDYIESTYEKATMKNENLRLPSARPTEREKIYQNIDSERWKEIFEAKLKVELQLKKRIISIIPLNFKRMIKRIKVR